MEPGEDQRYFAANPAVGCGNILHALVEHRAGSRWLHEPLLWLDHELVDLRGDVHTTLSPQALQRIVDDQAGWYVRAGIRPKDVVGVHIDEGIGYFVHFLALAAIGAIPLLINDVMPPAIVVRFLRKVGGSRTFVDAAHEAKLLPHLRDGEPVELLRVAPGTAAGPPPGPYPHPHAADDVVLLCHTSGTTGLPKAVMFTHHGFFHGIREQLKAPFIAGTHRDLSAFPQSHSAGIFRLMLNLLNGFPALVSSKHDARSLLPAIQEFKPTRLFGFPRTFVDIAEQPDVGAYDLRSLRYWVNTGDAIHESHIKRLVELGDPGGSTFVDRFGSSEQGGALFMQEHRRGGQTFERCIGRPLEWVEAVILDEHGKPQEPGRAGLLAVKAPSVTPGYWQDPALTAQFRIGEYWLTGDIARRDANGCFFHLDRTVDAIRTRDGLVCSVELEELLQRECRAIEEATVVGVSTAAGDQVPIVIVRPSAVFTGDTTALLAECNRVCARHGVATLAKLIVATAAEIPVGATGKVLKRELRERYAQILSGDAT